VDPQLVRQWLPIAISLVSLIVAGVALGWNIYRDVILKARVRVHFAVIGIVTPGQPSTDPDRRLRIGVTNHGPGAVKIEMIHGQEAPLWRRLLRRPQHFVILNDHTNPLNPRLPHRLEVGDTLTLLLPYNQDCFLKGAATNIGVSDSFGRLHFAPRAHIKAARALFERDFWNAS
jgi:hypothetical protein